jgi:hypothetical protein
MCIYCNTDNYRKIYENHHGPILREPDGRAYEVHHIDGDHSNNNPANLSLVTLQEHYDIHYAQGDYGACFWMATQRMNKSHAELSDLASKRNSVRNKKYVELGIHNFLGGEIQRKWNREAVKNGTHHLLGPTQNNIRIKAGTHNLLGGAVTRAQLANGAHATQIRLCCLGCKKETHIVGFSRSHKECVNTAKEQL